MKIRFVEIQNFRRFRLTHIDFDNETTIFVGANNSGKTSAGVTRPTRPNPSLLMR
ncbi:MAG: ATP-binding protein [Gammaproteobacteria bacterium]|nr:ATP-binding protein [Gammaproteobacteria bacterium]